MHGKGRGADGRRGDVVVEEMKPEEMDRRRRSGAPHAIPQAPGGSAHDPNDPETYFEATTHHMSALEPAPKFDKMTEPIAIGESTRARASSR
jgi:hypothetical protein